MSKRNIILIGIIIVLMVVAYTVFFGGNTPKEIGLETTSTKASASSQVGKEILASLNTLESLTLDVDFFKNDLFQSLNDQTKTVLSQPVGRNNPFLPVGRESGLVNVGTSTAR